MGSCLQSAAPVNDSEATRFSVQDAAAAIKAETAAVKLLMKQTAARESIHGFLTSNRTDLLVYYSYYVELDDLKILDHDLPSKNSKLCEILDQYKDLLDPFRKVHQDIRDALILPSTNRSVIEGLIQQAKTEALLQLNSTFDQYRRSPFYIEFEKSQKRNM